MINTKQISIGEYLLDALYKRGVAHIFGVPGDYVLRFDKLIEEHPDVTFINATRENTAGYLADAYARLRGMGAACITYGVGINIVNALSQAYVENSPIIVISGAPSEPEITRCPALHHLLHKSITTHLDTTQLEIFKQVTIDQAVLDNPETAGQEIDRILDACFFYKKPVYIEIPRNMVDQKISKPTSNSFKPPQSASPTLQEALEEIATLLKNSKKPFIWAGHDIQCHGLGKQLLQFAEKHNIPIASTLLGKTAIDENHPLSMGVYQGKMSRPEVSDFVHSCDCALLFGVIINDVDTGIFTAQLPPNKLVISSSSSPLKIGHHQYQNLLFADFIQGLSEIDIKRKFDLDYPRNNERLVTKFTALRNTKTTSKRVFECLQAHLKPEHIIISDIGDSLFGSIDLVLPANSFMSCAHFGTLGFGTPGAIGAALAVPEKRIIGIVGDGGFQMTATELSTAVRYHLDPIIIILNNHGYGTERPIIEGSYNDILNWDYTAITKLLKGGVGIKVANEEELDKALTQAIGQRGEFVLIEVELGKLDFSDALKRLGEFTQKIMK